VVYSVNSLVNKVFLAPRDCLIHAPTGSSETTSETVRWSRQPVAISLSLSLLLTPGKRMPLPVYFCSFGYHFRDPVRRESRNTPAIYTRWGFGRGHRKSDPSLTTPFGLGTATTASDKVRKSRQLPVYSSDNSGSTSSDTGKENSIANSGNELVSLLLAVS
jgi:hypothetical protein